MANYSKVDGYVFDKQSNVGWGLTLKMSGKAPAVAKRIFDTYEHALAYANDANDSAIEGLVLSVVADTDVALNGVYFVQQVGVKADEEKGIEAVEAILVKLGSEDYVDTEIEANAKTYSIAKATDEEVGTLGANVKEAYKLVDEDDKQVGEYILVYKDSALKSAELIDQQLVFTYTLADNTEQVVEIDVSTFLAESEFKNGLYVNQNGEVSVKVDVASEAFLTVGTDGVKLAGVQDAINIEKARAEAAENGLTDAIAAETAARENAIADLDANVTSSGGTHVKVKVTEVDGIITAVNVTETDIASASVTTDAIADLEEKINNKSQIVDVTNLFTKGGQLSGYTMQELANSHLVYKDTTSVALNGTPFIQVSMVGGSASNSTVVIDDTTTIPSFGNYCTLIAEIYSEQNGKYILTQYLARVEVTGFASDVWTTNSVEQHILATQKSIDTLTTEVNKKQDTISDLETIRSGAALGATALQSIPEEYVTETELNAVEDSLESSKQDKISDLTTIRSGAALGATSVQFIDVTDLFTEGKSMSGYTMQELANSHLVYQVNGGPMGTSSVQVTMVAGSAGNSIVVIDDTTQMPSFGNYCTLIFEMHSEGNLTQYVACVEFNNNNKTCTTTKVNSYVLATQDEVNKKQDTISDLETIRSGAALGATSVQIIDVTDLFTEGKEIGGYNLNDLMSSTLWYNYSAEGDIGGAVKYVAYGDGGAYNPEKAYLVLDSMVWGNTNPYKTSACSFVAEVEETTNGILSIRTSEFPNIHCEPIDVKPLFTSGGTMSGYTLNDLMTNALWYNYSSSDSIGNSVKYVGYGNAINSKSGEANLVMESFDGTTRQVSIAHIKANGSTLTTDSVKTYSSNVFVMRVSQVDYETMKAAGTLDENTLYVIAEITE